MIQISERQQQFHESTELLSVLFCAPFSFYLATRKELPGWARLASAGLGLAILYVDGGLVATWAAKRRGELGPFGVVKR